MQPLVSIIIPTFNRAGLIPETLESIRAQTHQNWECIVVDDGSQDDTQKVIMDFVNSDNRFQYHERPSNRPKGANACRNYGLEICKGEFVNWFDSDDLMIAEKLEIQLNGLRDSGLPFSVCQTLVFEHDPANVLGLRNEHIISDTVFEDFVRKKIVWLTQAPLFVKKFLDDNSFRFDESLQAAQEWEFFSRILMSFPHYHVESRPLVLLRQHENSISYDPQKARDREASYLRARSGIYRVLRTRGISPALEHYFSTYFYNAYRTRLQSHKFEDAFGIYAKFLSRSQLISLKDRVRLLFAYVSYRMLGKGEKFLKIKMPNP